MINTDRRGADDEFTCRPWFLSLLNTSALTTVIVVSCGFLVAKAVATVNTVFGFDELVSAILSHVSDTDIQQVILSLSRVFPRHYFPLQRFLSPITLRHPEQCMQLHRRLRGPHPDVSHVRELRVQNWSVDAETVSNLLDVLDNLKLLALFVGPNFAPPILQRIMEKPRDDLETLMIRFRP